MNCSAGAKLSLQWQVSLHFPRSREANTLLCDFLVESHYFSELVNAAIFLLFFGRIPLLLRAMLQSSSYFFAVTRDPALSLDMTQRLISRWHARASEESSMATLIDVVGRYDLQVQRAIRGARQASNLSALSKRLVVLSAIVATVVLLGSYVSSLLLYDFLFIPTLLFVLQETTLSAIAFFNRAVFSFLCSLVTPRSTTVRPFLQLGVIILAGLGLPLYRLFTIHYDSDENIQNFLLALRLFYALLLLNALVSLGATVVEWRATRNPLEHSILELYNEVYGICEKHGFSVISRPETNICAIAFKMLCRVNESWPIDQRYGLLIIYLAVPQRGVGYLEAYLEAGDVVQQEVAMKVVCFWIDRWVYNSSAYDQLTCILEELYLPESLRTMLADKLGRSHVGRMAADVFGRLTTHNPWLVSITRTSTGQRVIGKLADLVDDSDNSVRKHSLFFVEPLVLFYSKCLIHTISAHPFPKEILDLVPRLKELLAKAEMHRLRVKSAYLLLLLQRYLKKECVWLILAISPPQEEPYWRDSDKLVLDYFYENIQSVANHRPPAYPRLESDIAVDIYRQTLNLISRVAADIHRFHSMVLKKLAEPLLIKI